MAGFVMLGDLDLTVQGQGQAGTDLADAHDRLPGRIGARLAEPAQALDLLAGQRRKHLVAARIEDGRLAGFAHPLFLL